MAILAVSHVAVGVRDMERSLAFYRDALGMKVTLDAVEEIPAIGDEPALQRRGVYLRWSDGPHASFVVLDQHLSKQPFGEPARLFQVGAHHFSFWVDDVDELVRRVAEAGFAVVSQPGDADSVTYGEAPGGTVRSAFLRDPDGNFVQLDQRVGV